MARVLVVEDDNNILTGIVDNLEMEHYEISIAQDGETALRKVEEDSPDLIILDIMLPRLNGLEVCKHLKAKGVNTPIIILSAKGSESDKVLGLELGADDYVTKPFSPRELIARVRANLRRASGAIRTEDTYQFDNVRIDFKRYQVFKKNKEISLTSTEFTILKLLIVNRGEPVGRHTILSRIWDGKVTTRTIDTHIWSLRKKLEKDPSDPKRIVTVQRIGYKFVE